MSTEKSVLSAKNAAGPHGLGDPADKSLRKVEVEVLIPKLMREKAKAEKCSEQVKEFEKCCKDSSLLMVVTCRKQNAAMKECLTNWYRDEEFRNICTEEYLNERSAYRQSGIRKPIKRA
ncbi:COX assembly mitochondrial protein homolog [Plodia interpunctella]|uniref:COX assembly mitochondrial protein homolog n=1 Tax=Plodia interpunctella TaxID=58824 RepID=UPI0023676B06|nr:COX assembly mitochondrial protein homolog [Plodia interpunctella]